MWKAGETNGTATICVLYHDGRPISVETFAPDVVKNP